MAHDQEITQVECVCEDVIVVAIMLNGSQNWLGYHHGCLDQ